MAFFRDSPILSRRVRDTHRKVFDTYLRLVVEGVGDMKESVPAAATPSSPWYPLFEHMSLEHGLTLLDGELAEIANKADESRLKSRGRSDMVLWILVNALYHLDTEQLHELGEEVSKRSGGKYNREGR